MTWTPIVHIMRLFDNIDTIYVFIFQHPLLQSSLPVKYIYMTEAAPPSILSATPEI